MFYLKCAKRVTVVTWWAPQFDSQLNVYIFLKCAKVPSVFCVCEWVFVKPAWRTSNVSKLHHSYIQEPLVLLYVIPIDNWLFVHTLWRTCIHYQEISFYLWLFSNFYGMNFFLKKVLSFNQFSYWNKGFFFLTDKATVISTSNSSQSNNWSCALLRKWSIRCIFLGLGQ